MSAFVDPYDVALFDLDGVLYLGPTVVPGAPEALARLRERGVRTIYVTNNAARSEQAVADHLTELGFAATLDDLATSALATKGLLRDTLPAGARVLVVGSPNLVGHVTAAGMRVVDSAADAPAALVMGYDPDLHWPRLDEASFAVHAGARWIATNGDLTRPTDRGIVPGLGAMLAAVTLATGRQPDIVVGKPHRTLMDDALRRAAARRAVFVGDRIDTDIMGAHAAGIDSLLVMTGAHGRHALLDAPPEGRPTAIGWSVADLLLPRRTASVTADGATCGGVRVEIVGDEAVLSGDLGHVAGQLDALWALAQLVWAGRVSAQRVPLAALDLLP